MENEDISLKDAYKAWKHAQVDMPKDLTASFSKQGVIKNRTAEDLLSPV